MTQEFGALLAQVIPVIALTLGLELRQLSREARTEVELLRQDRIMAAHFLLTIAVIGLALAGLALLENYSLASALGRGTRPWWLIGLYIVVIITFSAPVVDEAHRVVGGRVRPSRRGDIALTAALVALPIVLLAGTIVIVW
jgi:hypothetical protein